MNALIDHIHQEFDRDAIQPPHRPRSSRACIYQVSTGHPSNERRSSSTKEKTLSVRIAVNGVSKSVSGHLPLSNLDLTRGDFGDDAGMVVENEGISFIGALNDSIEQEWASFSPRLGRWRRWKSIPRHQSCGFLTRHSSCLPTHPSSDADESRPTAAFDPVRHAACGSRPCSRYPSSSDRLQCSLHLLSRQQYIMPTRSR